MQLLNMVIQVPPFARRMPRLHVSVKSNRVLSSGTFERVSMRRFVQLPAMQATRKRTAFTEQSLQLLHVSEYRTQVAWCKFEELGFQKWGDHEQF
jgi:hypothetical protein